MPYSEKQRMAAAIAKSHPSKLHAENRSMLSMSKEELHDMASGPIKKKGGIREALANTKRDDIDK